MSVEARWWTRPFRTFQTNLREIDAGLDVEHELDVIKAYGANVWLLSTAGIIANYPSELSAQTVNPALTERESGDLIGDAIAAAKSRGVRVLGRMDFSKIDARRAEQHPEWCFVDRTGAPQIYNGYSSVCPSGQYYQKAMFEVLSEVLGAYDLSGFFFNMMSFNEYDYSRRYWGVCHCAACREGFGEFAPGVVLPVGPDSSSYPRWRSYTAHVLDDLHARLRDHVQKLNPHAALIQGDRADITFHEANNAIGRPLWHHATSEAVSAARSGDPQRPVLVNSVGFIDMPYRWAGEDPNHFAQYLIQAMAHGAQPSTYVMGTTGDSPYEGLGVGAEVIRFHRDNEEIYDGLHSVARVALVRGPRAGGSAANTQTSEFRGHYLALSERHIPFDVVRSDHLSDLDPQRYRLIVLPDLGVLDADQAQALNAALAAGSTVAATGDSAWVEGRSQLGDGKLAQQVATYSTEEAVRALHLRLRNQDGGDLAPVVEGFGVLVPTEAAQTDWPALGRARYGPPEQCYGHEPTGHPGWVSGAVGPGTLALIPWRPGLVYREIGLSRVRDARIDKLLALSSGALPISTDLPMQIQVVHGETVDRTVLHLLNRSGDAPQRFVEPVPIAPGTLRIPVRGPSSPTVRARVAGTELRWRIDGRDLEIDVPAIGRFEVIDTKW